MDKERLELMVTMLREVAAGTWRPAAEAAHKPTTFDLNNWLIAVDSAGEQPCGYAACAIGHATCDARFNTLGLHATPEETPQYLGFFGWAAATSFFGLTYKQAIELFAEEAYTPSATGPLDVAARITSYLEA